MARFLHTSYRSSGHALMHLVHGVASRFATAAAMPLRARLTRAAAAQHLAAATTPIASFSALSFTSSSAATVSSSPLSFSTSASASGLSICCSAALAAQTGVVTESHSTTGDALGTVAPSASRAQPGSASAMQLAISQEDDDGS